MLLLKEMQGRADFAHGHVVSRHYIKEINYGAFESVIELPEGYDVYQAKAAYQNGFLRIDVPQQKRPASKNISVLLSDSQ